MADDIHNLVLSPFRDIVSKGNRALENATKDNSDPMAKAARSLVNNAERALKKIEPVCQRQLHEYQSAFIDALKENDDITHFRAQLNDMIWDLDDCIEVSTFDAEVYTKLQILLRTAALKISDIVIRMKLEYPRQPETPMTPASERPRTPSIIVSPSPGSPMEAKAGPVQGWEEGEDAETAAGAGAAGAAAGEGEGEEDETKPSPQYQERPAHHLMPESPTPNTPTIHLEPVPTEPRENPWRGPVSESLTLQIHSLSTEDALTQRRPRISPSGQNDAEPVSPLTPENEAATPPFNPTPSSPRDDIVSPLDEDPRNSVQLLSEYMTSATATWASRSFPRRSSNSGPEQPDELAPPSSVCSEYPRDGPLDDTTAAAADSGKVVIVPDTEGLIPVEGEYDIRLAGHDQHPDQHPTAIAIDSFPRSQSGGVNRSPPPPSHGPPPFSAALRIETGTKFSNQNWVSPLLDLAPGSKVINVSFPAQYNGEWAVGWDSVLQSKGLFSMDCVKLEMPTGEDAVFFKGMGGGGGEQSGGGIGIGIGRRRGRSASTGTGGIFGGGSGGGGGNHGLSGLSAVARWGFGGSGSNSGGSAPTSATLKKEKERSGFSFGGGGSVHNEGLQWLRFEKGEVITGICFPHSQHWCWAGYNSKNKWGIFPRAFMTPGTLLEEAPSNLIQLLHKEGNNRPQNKQTSPASGGPVWESSSPSSPPSSGAGGVGIGSTFLSKISSKGFPLPLGLRRFSSGPGVGIGAGNNATCGDSASGSSGGSFFSKSSNNNDNEWASKPSDGEPTPDSPSGSFFTHAPGGAASNSTTTTRSPRPSLY